MWSSVLLLALCLAASEAMLSANPLASRSEAAAVQPALQVAWAPLEELPADMDSRILEFNRWLERNSVSTQYVRIVRQAGWLGVEFARDVPSGTILFEVPWRLTFRLDTALRHPVVGPLVREFYATFPREEPDAMPGMYAVFILLHYEAFIATDSFWLPYLRILPTRFRGAYFFSPDELAVLNLGDANTPIVDQARNNVELTWEHLRDWVFARHPEIYGDLSDPTVARQRQAECVWVYHTAVSRLYGPRFEHESVTLIPFADLLNHVSTANSIVFVETRDTLSVTRPLVQAQRAGQNVALADVDLSTSSFLVNYAHLASTAHQRGEPLVTRYDGDSQPKCAIHFLTSYGFVPNEAYPLMDCFPLTVGFQVLPHDADPLRVAVQQALVTAGVIASLDHKEVVRLSTTLRRTQPIPTAFLRAVRISQLRFGEFGRLAAALNGSMVSLANELRTLRTVRAAIDMNERKLRSAQRDLETRGILPRNPSDWSPNTQLAMAVVEGMFRALEDARAQTERMWGSLLNSDYNEVDLGVAEEKTADDLLRRERERFQGKNGA